MAHYRGKRNHWHRRVGEHLLDTILLSGLFAKWSYHFGLHGRFRVTRHDVSLPAGKRLPRPLTIAFASDFHAGPTTHPAIFDDLLDGIQLHRPDILLLGGDFVSGKAVYIGGLAERLARYNPPLGKFAVFGNHDLWADDVHLENVLAEAGIRVLVNRNIGLPTPFETVSICGMDDPWTGDPDMRRTLGGAMDVRILLMHAPDGLLFLGAERFDVGFAGHTHGGQIALSDGTPIVVPSGPLSRKYCHGKYALDESTSLIVSRGVGCSNIPVRVNADPELVICTLS
jgi:uncharacterized protein